MYIDVKKGSRQPRAAFLRQSLPLSNQASAPFFNLDPAGQLSGRILEHFTLIGVKPWKPLIQKSQRR